MLLDALLAATERLIITYTGNDERTNLPRPPAVPVGELLDTVDRTVSHESGPAREQVLVHHPLQPFDPRNFTARAAHARAAVELRPRGARRRACTDRPRGPPRLGSCRTHCRRCDAPLIELESLVRFVEHPARAFLRGRLGISVREFADEVDDELPVELDGLGEWGVGQRLLDGVLGGATLEDCVRAELARGSLPPGKLAEPALDRVRPVVQVDRRRRRGARRRRVGDRLTSISSSPTGGRSPGRCPACAGDHPQGLILAREAARPAGGLGQAAGAERRPSRACRSSRRWWVARGRAPVARR